MLIMLLSLLCHIVIIDNNTSTGMICVPLNAMQIAEILRIVREFQCLESGQPVR